MRISEIIKPAKTIDYPFVVHSMHLPSRWAQAEASSVRRALVRLFFLLSSSFHSILYILQMFCSGLPLISAAQHCYLLPLHGLFPLSIIQSNIYFFWCST